MAVPIHDWSRVDPAYFHSFSLGWVCELSRSLNNGWLPSSYFSMTETLTQWRGPHLVQLPEPTVVRKAADDVGRSLSAFDVSPRVWAEVESMSADYAEKAISVRPSETHHPVAAILFVTEANKRSSYRSRVFIERAVDIVRSGIHAAIIDLFATSDHVSFDVQHEIWRELMPEPLVRPANQPLCAISYRNGWTRTAYVQPSMVGDTLPELPLFISSDTYVPLPLEETYSTAWAALPEAVRRTIEGRTG